LDRQQTEELHEQQSRKRKISDDYNIPHFHDRVDENGKMHSFDKILRVIADVNEEFPEALIRGFMGKTSELHSTQISESTLARIYSVELLDLQ
jgi:hypothetical protein